VSVTNTTSAHVDLFDRVEILQRVEHLRPRSHPSSHGGVIVASVVHEMALQGARFEKPQTDVRRSTEVLQLRTVTEVEPPRPLLQQLDHHLQTTEASSQQGLNHLCVLHRLNFRIFSGANYGIVVNDGSQRLDAEHLQAVQTN
jgi:hypothetical protein